MKRRDTPDTQKLLLTFRFEKMDYVKLFLMARARRCSMAALLRVLVREAPDPEETLYLTEEEVERISILAARKPREYETTMYQMKYASLVERGPENAPDWPPDVEFHEKKKPPPGHPLRQSWVKEYQRRHPELFEEQMGEIKVVEDKLEARYARALHPKWPEGKPLPDEPPDDPLLAAAWRDRVQELEEIARKDKELLDEK